MIINYDYKNIYEVISRNIRLHKVIVFLIAQGYATISTITDSNLTSVIKENFDSIAGSNLTSVIKENFDTITDSNFTTVSKRGG
jgi:TRAP-type C4-dicarboxylate transport system permease large subunit